METTREVESARSAKTTPRESTATNVFQSSIDHTRNTGTKLMFANVNTRKFVYGAK